MSAVVHEPEVSPPGAARAVTPVGVLATRLDDLVATADAAGVDDAFRDALRAARDLAAGLDPYAQRCTTPESAELRAIAEQTAAHDWTTHTAGDGSAPLEQEMISGHVEGGLLAMLVHATRARRVLDVGLFTGYSALAMAQELAPGGRVIACEVDEHVAALARDALWRSDAGRRIDVRVGPAATTLCELALAGDVFDLVFIDADKAGYRDYVDLVLTGGLLAPHGLMCIDNTLMQGLPWTDPAASRNAEAITVFNRELAEDPRVVQVLLPVRDGVTLARRVDG